MSEPITPDEVLSVAIDMENTGKIFYEALAQGCGKPGMAKVCEILARAETQHAALFTRMLNQMPRDERSAPMTDEQAEQFHQAITRAVIPNPDEVRKVALQGKAKDALALAVGMEQDSIRYYENVVRPAQPEHTAIVDTIIREERKHLADLKALMAS